MKLQICCEFLRYEKDVICVFVRFTLQFVSNFNILCDLWSFIIPEYVLYLYFKFFKGVHLKRAISSEQWTHELLKHEKFHSGKLSSIERIVMSNRIKGICGPIQKEKISNTSNTKRILCTKRKVHLCSIIFAIMVLPIF